MAKSSPYFRPWLPSWEPHKNIFMGCGNNQRGRKKIISYQSVIINCYKQLIPVYYFKLQIAKCADVELLMVKVFCICENAQVDK